MKTIKISIMAIGLMFLMSSCMNTKPLFVTDNEVGGRVGTSSNTCLFTMPAYGSYSTQVANSSLKVTSAGLCFNSEEYGIADAADDGNINKVATVDLKVKNYLLFTVYELKVAGK
ncbi:MAG: hypothetical protein ABEH43_04455 [Flavobacteriales bacterium]